MKESPDMTTTITPADIFFANNKKKINILFPEINGGDAPVWEVVARVCEAFRRFARDDLVRLGLTDEKWLRLSEEERLRIVEAGLQFMIVNNEAEDFFG